MKINRELTERVVENFLLFFFQAEDGIRDRDVTGVQTCALPISDCPDALVKKLSEDVVAAIRQDKDIQVGDADKISALVEAKIRSEERRVGKECRARGSRYH